MSSLEIWLLAFSLAIDCFTVSVTSGCLLKRFQFVPILKMSLLFGIFQAFMPLIGWSVAEGFRSHIEAYDHWIVFGLLSLVGTNMIKEYFKGNENHSFFDPTKFKVMLTLAVATSLDALAVGISFTFTGFTTLNSLSYPLCVIGLVAFLLSIVGVYIGLYMGKKINIPFEIIGGMVLICIGIKVLIEHSDHISFI